MTVRKWITAAFSAAGMLILIFDGQTALKAAASGVELCLKTVIPSLFPFLFLCALLTNALWGGSTRWLRWIGKHLGIPEGAESLLISAVLGGYPAGAQAIGEAYRENRLEKRQAEHLLTFCSNAGPAFLFGIVSSQFPDPKMVWALWVIQIYAAAMTGMLGTEAGKATLSCQDTTISQIMTQTVKTMGIVCGWILFFRILTEFLNRWVFWLFPKALQVVFTGILELSNGCCSLTQIQEIPLRFLVCSGFLSFGGLCVTMQTASVIGKLSFRHYLLGKLVQTGFSLSLALLFLTHGWQSLLFLGACILFFPVLPKKRSRFPNLYGV